MTELIVDSNIDNSVDLLGKTVNDLQSNITISLNAISGELNYVTNYTDFSNTSSEQSGNYLALHSTENITSIQAIGVGPNVEYEDVPYAKTGDYYIIKLDGNYSELKLRSDTANSIYSLSQLLRHMQ